MYCDNRISLLHRYPFYAGLRGRIGSLVQRGRSIRAMFVLRAITGMGPKEAYTYVKKFM
jgi:hypothetical protein